MERKLELRDIAGYLPYGVFAKFYDINFISKIDFASVGCLLSGKEPMRMILRPLPDLYKPIIHNGKEEVPMLELAKITFGTELFDVAKNVTDALIPFVEVVSKNNNSLLHFFYDCGQFKVNMIHGKCELHCNQFPLFDYLHSRFIDYRRLIDAGLAISVYDLENNPYK